MLQLSRQNSFKSSRYGIFKLRGDDLLAGCGDQHAIREDCVSGCGNLWCADPHAHVLSRGQNRGRDTPPAITHPEYFYGFLGGALAWQFLFLVLSTDPVRYRPMILPATALFIASYVATAPVPNNRMNWSRTS